MVAKIETRLFTHQFEKLYKTALDDERSLRFKVWDVCSKALLLQAAVIADLLRTCRVDKVTTLRTGKEEVWNEIYFSRKENVPCCCKSKKNQATF